MDMHVCLTLSAYIHTVYSWYIQYYISQLLDCLYRCKIWTILSSSFAKCDYKSDFMNINIRIFCKALKQCVLWIVLYQYILLDWCDFIVVCQIWNLYFIICSQFEPKRRIYFNHQRHLNGQKKKILSKQLRRKFEWCLPMHYLPIQVDPTDPNKFL